MIEMDIFTKSIKIFKNLMINQNIQDLIIKKTLSFMLIITYMGINLNKMIKVPRFTFKKI